jgi:hypothetical protein
VHEIIIVVLLGMFYGSHFPSVQNINIWIGQNWQALELHGCIRRKMQQN